MQQKPVLKSFTGALRKSFRVLGLDVRRVSPFEIPEESRLLWLQRLGIRTVLDVGANVGQFAQQMHAVIPDAYIYSFEPLADCYAALVSGMKDVRNFKAFNIALGDENGETRIHRNRYAPASSLLSMDDLCKEAYPSTGEESVEAIRVRRLDDLASQLDGPDNLLVKIDVQGFEDRVIQGGRTTIARAKLLLVETSYMRLYKGQLLFDDIYEMLKHLGFTYRGSLEQYPSPIDGSPLQEDSVFMRSADLTANS